MARGAAAATTARCSTRTASTRSCKRHYARYTPEMVERVDRLPARDLPEGGRGAGAQFGPRAHQRLLLRGRLDAAHDRRADDPRRGDPAGAARQHRAARRRHPGAARPLPPSRAAPTSRRSTTCCPATCRSRTRCKPHQTCEDYLEHETRADRLVAQLPEVHGQPAEGLVRRRARPRRTTGATTGCRRSSATTRSCR